MKASIYVEGGGTSKHDQIRCRKGFRTLFEKAGFAGRMPALIACGPRDRAFKDFENALGQLGSGGFVAMLIDSEVPLADLEKPWRHLKTQDKWRQPAGARDEQVLFMTTCMETWIVADREALKKHFGDKLQLNALPATQDLEAGQRKDILDKLVHATRNCKTPYAKGSRSFEVLSLVNPAALKPLLPSFARAVRILEQTL